MVSQNYCRPYESNSEAGEKNQTQNPKPDEKEKIRRQPARGVKITKK